MGTPCHNCIDATKLGTGCKGLKSDSVIYTGPNLPCSNIINGDSITLALQKLDAIICDNQNNFVRDLFIDIADLPPFYSFQDICDYILALPEAERTIQETDSKWNVLLGNFSVDPTILEIYEIQNIGKGIITVITPENLLLFNQGSGSTQNLQSVLDVGNTAIDQSITFTSGDLFNSAVFDATKIEFIQDSGNQAARLNSNGVLQLADSGKNVYLSPTLGLLFYDIVGETHLNPAPSVTGQVFFNFPTKVAGSYILATLDDVVGAPDATTLIKGILQLTGDLGGTAASPTTPTALHKTGDETFTGTKTLISSSGTSGRIFAWNQTTALAPAIRADNDSPTYASIVGNSNAANGRAIDVNVSVQNAIGVRIKDIQNSPNSSVLLSIENQLNNTGTPLNILRNSIIVASISHLGAFLGSSFIKSGGTALQYLMADGSVSLGSVTPDATTLIKGILQLAGDLGGTAALPTTPTAVHKTGNEIILGTKTFNKTATTSNIISNNSAAGYGIESHNTSTGAGIYASNNQPGPGGAIFSLNSAGGYGIFSSNTSNGFGIYTDNSSSGVGLYADNYGTGIGIKVNNSSSGHAMLVNSVDPTTGLNYVGQNNGVNTFTVDKLGAIIANTYTGGATLTGTPIAPTAAPGTNTTQIATTAFVLANLGSGITGTGVSGQVSFWNGTSTQTGDTGLTWDNTTKKLTVASSVSGNITFRVLTSLDSGQALDFKPTQTAVGNGYFSLDTNANSSGWKNIVIPAGNVGIGTTAPSAGNKLEVVGNVQATTYNGVKIYKVLASQGGTSAPIANILANTLSGVPVWTRTGVGVFRLTLAGAFPAFKTIVLFGEGLGGYASSFWSRLSNDVIEFYTSNAAGVLVDDSWNLTGLSLEVYP